MGIAESFDFSYIAENFVPYPGYLGSFTSVEGTVSIASNVPGDQVFFLQFQGLDTYCDMGALPGTGNSCGVHVHSGRTCTDDAGGHYFTGEVEEDPWATVAYTSGRGSLTVTTGATEADINGRAVVIHDRSGARIACSLLGRAARSGGGGWGWGFG